MEVCKYSNCKCWFWHKNQCPLPLGECQHQPQGTQDKSKSLESGWLERQFDEVEKEVENWPEWKK